MGQRLCWALLSLLAAALPAAAEPPPPTPPTPVKIPGTSTQGTTSPYPTAEPFTPKTGAELHEAEHEEETDDEQLPCRRLWFTGEYLLWRIRDSSPPLLATSGQAGDPRPGALDNPNTRLLFGGADVNNNYRSGARFFLGGWFDHDELFGAETGYFFLGSRQVSLTRSGTGAPNTAVLARPFLNALDGQADASLDAFPGVLAGGLRIVNASRMQGAEANAVVTLLRNRGFRLDGLAGCRFVELREFLDIAENVQVFPNAPVFPGSSIGVLDHFGTRNAFYGGQVGFKASLTRQSWHIDLLGKFAAGTMQEVIDISGGTRFTAPGGATRVVSGGLLALSSNIGQYQRDIFAVAPEAGVQFSYHVTTWLQVTAGYSVLFFSNVLRPGENVDTTVNPNLVPTSLTAGQLGGPLRPTFRFQGTDFFAHGVNFGLTFQY